MRQYARKKHPRHDPNDRAYDRQVERRVKGMHALELDELLHGERDDIVQTVYVQLLGEAVEVWRPVDAVAEAADIYRLPPKAPGDEVWRFPPGSCVRCEWRSLSDGRTLVATELLR